MYLSYELLDLDCVDKMTDEIKKQFYSDVVSTGKIMFYEKFIVGSGLKLNEIFSYDEILKLLPISLDSDFLEIILKSFEFPQGDKFFYNYGLYHVDMDVKIVIYNYFVDNYSYLMVDNCGQYDRLLTHKNLYQI